MSICWSNYKNKYRQSLPSPDTTVKYIKYKEIFEFNYTKVKGSILLTCYPPIADLSSV